jgi:phenylalanyl-tRNA synthetase alpha chain
MSAQPSLPELRLLSPEALSSALALRDLTDPSGGPHAMQLIVDAVVRALAGAWRAKVVVHRAPPLVSVHDNYDRLGYAPDAIARDARYTRYVTAARVLRTHTSAMIPPLLSILAGAEVHDVLCACPGIVYRRDAIDRLHTGEPHQLDLWRVRSTPLDDGDLLAMIDLVVAAALPGARWRAVDTAHPYTERGKQIDVLANGAWIEIGECGLASPAVLRGCGHAESTAGLAMGLGLDRLLMLRKGLDDIRLLRAADPRISTQMLDLGPYEPVSRMPATARDLSIVVAAGADAESIGDRVRTAIGDRSTAVEEIAIASETPYDALPARARERLGIAPGQKNVLVRLVLREVARTLTSEEANALRNDVYRAIHEGAKSEWAT